MSNHHPFVMLWPGQSPHSSPYEQGLRAGQWTLERVRECGFRSAKACLKHQEKIYKEELRTVSTIRAHNPDRGARHAAFTEGQIRAARSSLGALIEHERRARLWPFNLF
jgi:hypothetical protein